MSYKLGISTCPNDTFMFHAILERRIDMRGLELEVSLCDVQELNELAAAGALDFAKVSCFAAARLHATHEVCSSGAAIGFGVGPLLLRRPGAPELGLRARVLCPGALTTAGLLYRRFFPNAPRAHNVVFSEVMPALKSGNADYGVVIHEGRFTFREEGLELEADLGALWERAEHAPLPLGCIVVAKRLQQELREIFGDCLRRSVQYAFAHREETLATMRRHAQELQDDVIWAHVELYVNQWSIDLGEEGRRALRAFFESVAVSGAPQGLTTGC